MRKLLNRILNTIEEITRHRGSLEYELGREQAMLDVQNDMVPITTCGVVDKAQGTKDPHAYYNGYCDYVGEEL